MSRQTSSVHCIPLFFLDCVGISSPRAFNPSTEAVSAMVIPKHKSEWKATLWRLFSLVPCKSSHKLLINKWGSSQENQTKSLSYFLDHSQIIHHRHRHIRAAFAHTSQGGWLGSAKETKETEFKHLWYLCQSLAWKEKMNSLLFK